MRISDWSSDVCSSDLQLAAEFQSQNNPANAANMGAVTTQTEQQRLLNETYKSSVSQREAAVAIMRLETSEVYLNASATDQTALRQRERKSVVEGERVSVRVGIGGRRTLKKKNI